MGDDITIGVTEIVNTIEVTAQPNDQIVDINITDNTDNVTLNITPTVVEINVNKGVTSRWGNITGTLSDQDDLQGELDLKADLVDGKVPASQLPSYVDDVVEVANYAALPATGESGKIYITLNNNKIYRWTGSTYVEIADSAAVWGAITGTLSDQTDLQNALNGKQDDLNGTGIVKSTSGTISYLTDNSTNWDAAYNDKINSAEVTGTNTKTLTLTQQDGGTVTTSWSDINSGVWGGITGTLSNQTDLQQTLNTKEGTITGGTTSQYWRGDKTWQNLNKTAVGLANVDNTTDLGKPISTATQTALDLKVPTSRTITINGIGYDLSANVNFNIGVGVWGQITGTLSNQTDLQQTLNTKMPADRAITINGVTQSLTQDRSWTIPTIGGTGTNGYVAFWNGTSNQAGDSNFFWDNTNKRLGIGTTSPSSMLHARSGGYPTLTLEGGTNSGAGIRFFGDVQYAEIFGEYQSSGNGQMFFRTRNAGTISTAMAILSSGNVGIGTTSPSTKLDVVGAITASAGFFNSDMRLKDLIDYDYNVSDIKPISYFWKDRRDDKKHVGYSAQEVQKVMPDAVNEGEDGMLSVNYVEVLVAKIAELENRIKQLEK